MTASHTDAHDDRTLLQAWSRSREEAAFTLFVQRHLGMVQGAALRKTARPELAEDVAQAVFALAARRASSLSSHPCPAAWLHRTAVLESANALRRELKHRKLAAAMLTHPDTSPGDGMPHAALPHLDDALNSLPEHDRRAVLLRFGEKLSYEQMAARLGKSADACQKQTSRALERLRHTLSRRAAGITATALAAGLHSALNTPASAAAGQVSAAAIAAAPGITPAALTSHAVQTMSTGKQIAAAAGIAALLSSVPLGMNISEAATLREQLAARSVIAPPAAERTAAVSTASKFEPPGSRILPGVSAAEADSTIAMLRGLKGRMLTSAQMMDAAAQIMALPESHMAKALEAMADFPGLLPAGLLRTVVFARWGELNPEAALAALPGSKLDMISGEFARMALATGWLERDPLGFAHWLRDNAKSSEAKVLSTTLMLSGMLTSFDRATMQELYDVEPNGNYPGVMELAYETELENGDVAGVAERLVAKAPDDHRRDQLLESLARHLGEKEPKKAVDFIVSHPDPRGQLSQHALGTALEAWAESDLPAAMQWHLTHPEYGTECTWLYPLLSKRPEEEILRLAATAPDKEKQNSLISISAQCCGDPAKAMSLIASLPEDARPQAMETYSMARAGESTVKASEWLDALPNGADKDAAIPGFAPVLLKSEPDSALIWAASIQDEAKRAALLQQLGSDWLKKSPEAARVWIQQNETLTDADRAALLR